VDGENFINEESRLGGQKGGFPREGSTLKT